MLSDHANPPQGYEDFEEDMEEDTKSNSEFARMFEASFPDSKKKLKPGDKIRGEILTLGKDDIFASTGTMHDGMIPRRELLDKEGKMTAKVGDKLDLYVISVRGSEIILSPSPTAKNLSDDIQDAYDRGMAVEGRVSEICKGGFRVIIMGKSAFCPVSQMDSKRIDAPEEYVGKKLDFKITQISERGRNIVVSHRRLLDQQRGQFLEAFTQDHKPGDVFRGKVSRIEPFGAFVEIAPGVDGMVHISELRWSRVADPHEAVSLGQEVTVKLLRIEEGEKGLKLSLSIKQAEAEPWTNLPPDISVGAMVQGKVTRCMKFGAFVELTPGVEGLIPMSEMSYTKRVLRSDELFNEGDTVLVQIKDINPGEHRISLSFKDAEGSGDPWATVAQRFPVGTALRGKVERREGYGLFVRLEEGVVGLLPRSKAMDEANFNFDKVRVGDEIAVQVAELRLGERRISLSLPQDPDRDEWRKFQPAAGAAATGSFGTLADKLKLAMETGGGKKENKKAGK